MDDKKAAAALGAAYYLRQRQKRRQGNYLFSQLAAQKTTTRARVQARTTTTSRNLRQAVEPRIIPQNQPELRKKTRPQVTAQQSQQADYQVNAENERREKTTYRKSPAISGGWKIAKHTMKITAGTVAGGLMALGSSEAAVHALTHCI